MQCGRAEHDRVYREAFPTPEERRKIEGLRSPNRFFKGNKYDPTKRIFLNGRLVKARKGEPQSQQVTNFLSTLHVRPPTLPCRLLSDARGLRLTQPCPQLEQ